MKKGMVVFAMLVCASLVMGQTAIVEYMKVKPGDAAQYLAIEKEWMKIHEARQKAGDIVSWTLYENMYAGADEDYQYAVVTIYKDLAATANEGFEAASRVAYPNFSEKDWNSFFERTEKSRVLSSSEVFHRVAGINAAPGNTWELLNITAMNVKPGDENNYESLEKDIYQKIHQARIDAGKMVSWSIWAKWPGKLTDYQYVAVNSYKNLGQMTSDNFEEMVKKAFPKMTMPELWAKTNAARTMTETWMWRKLETIAAN